MLKPLFAISLALALAACTGTVIGGGTPYAGYDRDTVSHIASRGPIPIRTVGRLGDLTPLGTAEVVSERFRLPGDFTPATFSVATAAQTRDGFHLTFVFDPEQTPDVRAVCGPDAGSIPTATKPDRTRVVAAYCYRDEALNRVSARTPIAAPGTPAFGAFLDSIALALFPVSEPGLNLDKRRRSN